MSGGSATSSDNMDTDNIRTDNRGTDNIRRDEEWVIGGIFHLIPPAEYIRKCTNSKYLLVALVTIFIVYVSMILICGSFIQYPDSQQVPDKLLQENLNKVENLLIKLAKDEYNCFHCLSSHSSFKEIKDMGKKVQYQVAKETAYKKTRNVYNILAFLNIIMVFMIFDGPLLISITSTINSLFICLSMFLADSIMIYLEGFIVITSAIIFLKVSIVMTVAINNSDRRKRQ